MHVVTFQPTQEEQDHLNTLQEVNPEKVLCVESLHNNEAAIQDVFQNGYRYIAVRGMSQAKMVLSNSPLVSNMFMRFGIDSDLYIYELDKQLLGAALQYRRNADIEDDWMPDDDKLPLIPSDEEFESKKQSSYGISEWRISWWREVLQNSIDACRAVEHKRKGKIQCRIMHVEDSETVIIQVLDNGIGMDKQTLAEFFLKKGGSKKPLGAVGGLGRAKELLLFSFGFWKVKTRKDGVSANSAAAVEGKYDPIYYRPYIRRDPNEPIPEEFEGRFFGTGKKKTVGTTLTVYMKKSDYATADDLREFLNLSHVEGITITLEEKTVSSDRKKIIETTGPVVVEAKNKIPSKVKPPKELIRSRGVGAGSVWARIYHMPHAKKFQNIIVRINNLYMFKAPGRYEDISGKVIIELEYIPKGMQYDQASQKWVPLGREQKRTEYGPLELIQENRTALQNTYKINRYADELAAELQNIAKKGAKALKAKSRASTIERTKNENSVKRDWAELMENIRPQALMGISENESIENMFEIERAELGRSVGKINEVLEEVIGPDLESVSEERVSKLLEEAVRQGDLHENDISKALRAIQEGLVPSDLSLNTLQKVEISSVDTSANFHHWKKILAKLFADKAKQGNPSRFIENAMAFMHWEPDFILYDEVGDDEGDPYLNPNVDRFGHLHPKAPKKFKPQSFGQKEKRLAKYWTELVRFAFIVSGRGADLIKDQMGMAVGFHFENPPKRILYCRDCRVQYENSNAQTCSCGETLVELESEKAEWLGCYRIMRGQVNPQHNFRGIFITPATLTPPADAKKRGKWKHRYQVHENNLEDQSILIAIAFHEVAHALNPKGMEHDTEFASILTHYGLPYVWRYRSLFRTIMENATGKHGGYPLGRTGSAADPSKSPKYRAAMEARKEERAQRVEDILGQIADMGLDPNDYFQFRYVDRAGNEVAPDPEKLASGEIEATTVMGRWKKSRRVINALLGGDTTAGQRRSRRYRPGSRHGYYKVKCHKKTGRPKPYRTLADAMEAVDDRLEEVPDDNCEINAWYRGPTGHEADMGVIAVRGSDSQGNIRYWDSEETILENARAEWEENYRETYRDPRPSNEIFYRKKRMLKRRNPKQR